MSDKTKDKKGLNVVSLGAKKEEEEKITFAAFAKTVQEEIDADSKDGIEYTNFSIVLSSAEGEFYFSTNARFEKALIDSIAMYDTFRRMCTPEVVH